MKKPLITRTGYDVLSFKISEKKGIHKVIFFYLLTQLSLIFSDIYTVTSNTDKSFLTKYFYVPNENEKIRIRSNFVETLKYLPLDTRTTNEILMIGRLEQQKNYQYVINEFANSQYGINNYGSGEDFTSLVNLSKKNNVNIHFRDVIPNSKILEILNSYKFFISCSLFEGNPKSVLEAMGAGCIVFAARNPNIEEIITDGVTGFLFDLNENELINLFQSSIIRDDLNKISKSASKFVKENNNLEKLVKNESSDLQELLE
jgi:glycosyltransferase involved in cell wall biosynthesis